MKDKNAFDVIIIGGSYSGLAAGMALGRSLKKTLIIDSGLPCNRQTPYSHNFLTQDGKPPLEIASIAREQVAKYDTVEFMHGLATSGAKTENGFEIRTATGESFSARKLIFASGIKDIMPKIEGFAECWGISALHCPYCHGYEVRNEATCILGNGEFGFEFAVLISNWTQNLKLLTNGESTLTQAQVSMLNKHNITIIETPVVKLEHVNGYLQNVLFNDGTTAAFKALYSRVQFEQNSNIPVALGCELTEEGYIKIDAFQKTNVPGIFACGDNTTRMRSVANAVANGTTAGTTANREIIVESFQL